MADTNLLFWDGARIPVGFVAPTITTSYELDMFGNPWLETQRWDIEIRLVKDHGGDVDSQITSIANVFNTPADSIVIVDNLGNDTAHKISSANGLLGKIRRVAGPNYVKLTRGENVTVRGLSVTVEAILKKYTSDLQIINFTESVQIVKAGESTGIQQPNVGLAEIQTTRTNKHATFSQSGSVTWAAGWGTLPLPLMPIAYMVGEPQYTVRFPRYIGTAGNLKQIGHTIDYQYQFHAPVSMIAPPTVLT